MREENFFIKIFKSVAFIFGIFAFILSTELLVAFIISTVVNITNIGSGSFNYMDYAIYQVLFGQLVRGIFIYIFVKLRTRTFREAGKTYISNKGILLDSGKLIIVGLGVAGIGTIVINLIFYFLRDNEVLQNTITTIESVVVANDITGWIITFIAVVILAPIVEEYIFRGIIFAEMKKFWKIPATILITSILFGFYHGNIIQGINTFVMSIVLCIVYYYRRNITDAIIVHMVNNLVAFSSGIVPELSLYILIICYISIIISIYIIIGFKKDYKKNMKIQKEILENNE